MERKKVGSHLDLALEAAGEGMVLLQNDGTLPLKAAKIALFGTGALFAHPGGTGSGTVNGIEPLSPTWPRHRASRPSTFSPAKPAKGKTGKPSGATIT